MTQSEAIDPGTAFEWIAPVIPETERTVAEEDDCGEGIGCMTKGFGQYRLARPETEYYLAPPYILRIMYRM